MVARERKSPARRKKRQNNGAEPRNEHNGEKTQRPQRDKEGASRGPALEEEKESLCARDRGRERESS